MMSALRTALTASGCARGCAGSSVSSRMRVSAAVIADSPRITRPSWVRAASRMSSSVEGMMRPRTASTRPVSLSASSIEPVTPDMATMKRLPKECPSSPSPEPSGKRYWKSRVIRGSASASAAMQLRRSPGGITPMSRRSRPEEPPSSATVTIAEMLSEYSLSPRSRIESPVPPPMQTIRGPRAGKRLR